MGKEAKARIRINRLLEAAGWRFFDDNEGPANICLESQTHITQSAIDAMGEDFEKTSAGYMDFLLLDDKGFPLLVLEAKRAEINPLDAKEKTRAYANSQNVRFVILSNGDLHYFWDIQTGNPQIITSFPTQDSILQHQKFKPNPQNLIREDVTEDYILKIQKPDYATDPRWQDESQRDAFLADNGLKRMREYQVRAIHRLQDAAKSGNSRFLFEMATGTGKTLVAAAVIRLFLRTGNARRVLFLVDRLELENQAYKAFTRYLKNDYQTVIYKQKRNDWRKAEIVVTTVQSLLFNNKYRQLFSPTDFDLVISDEAHRSIGGNSRAVFDYFIGYKLGLTATPKDYLKNIKDIGTYDPREVERRLLLDTYKTFGCSSGEPTYRYSLLDGVADGFLVNPIVADARTEITAQMLSDQGYAVMVPDENGELVEKIYTHKDFERKFLSGKTNAVFCKTFFENALKDPITGEIGKTLIFCVSQNHAAKITTILNKMAHDLWPGRYNSDFACQVSSRIDLAQQMALTFANNNLNGHSRFNADFPGYKTAKTRVCVTVGMMTTGYDCEDILNLCLMRPIFSPQDFVQIKGRGTRKYTFAYKHKTASGADDPVSVAKQHFKLFDFFANCEYFEKKYNYDEVLKLPPLGGDESAGGTTGPVVTSQEFESLKPDPLKVLDETAIGADGMRIDREFFGRFAQTVKNDPLVNEFIAAGDWDQAQEYVRKEIFDKPEDFFNLDKLRKAVPTDRRLTLREMLEKIVGLIPYFKTKEDLLDEECDKFLSIYNPTPEQALAIKNILKAYIADADFRDIVETGQFARLATSPVRDDFRHLDPKWRQMIPEYVKDYVVLNKFM